MYQVYTKWSISGTSCWVIFEIPKIVFQGKLLWVVASLSVFFPFSDIGLSYSDLIKQLFYCRILTFSKHVVFCVAAENGWGITRLVHTQIFGKLIFLTPWYANALVYVLGGKMAKFWVSTKQPLGKRDFIWSWYTRLCTECRNIHPLVRLFQYWMLLTRLPVYSTTQKMKFSNKDFFSKCKQVRMQLWIWSHLLNKSSVENFIVSAVFSLPVHLWQCTD